MTGWRFSSVQREWNVGLLPDSVSIETATAYTSWSPDFRERLERVVRAVAEVVEPSFEQRLGLRYINQVPCPQEITPQNWSKYLAHGLTGPTRVGPFKGKLTSLFQQLHYSLEPTQDISANVLVGAGEDAHRQRQPWLMLDIDVYREGIRTFSVDGIRSTADTLADLAYELFTNFVDRRYLESIQ